MPIVRSDKRPNAIKLLGEIRAQLRGLLTQADALQAATEALEIELGVSNEGEQATRDQLMVIHCPQGSETAHGLNECTDECIAVDSLEAVGEGGAEEPEAEQG